MRPGIFVSFEGSEGCGKSTQIREIRTLLETCGVRCLATREPGGTVLGEVIRDLLKHAPEGRGMFPEAELLLFSASRAQLVREQIMPALASGQWVLADRFHDSSLVYQGIARG
ncbi:MAG: dTMP kinase, partial [Verrucomicrobiales bacterium]